MSDYDGEIGFCEGHNYQIYWDLEQRSELWHELRKNSCGGTGAYSLLVNGYSFEKASEPKKRYYGAVSKAAEWGAKEEPISRMLFKQALKNKFDENGWVGLEAGIIIRTDLKKKCHYSPDWLLTDKNDKNNLLGLVEIKNYQVKHHLEVVERKEADDSVIAQMQFGMFMTDTPFCYYVSSCRIPECPNDKRLFIKKYKRDEDYMKRFEELLR